MVVRLDDGSASGTAVQGPNRYNQHPLDIPWNTSQPMSMGSKIIIFRIVQVLSPAFQQPDVTGEIPKTIVRPTTIVRPPGAQAHSPV
jgi:hypothetical protein